MKIYIEFSGNTPISVYRFKNKNKALEFFKQNNYIAENNIEPATKSNLLLWVAREKDEGRRSRLKKLLKKIL